LEVRSAHNRATLSSDLCRKPCLPRFTGALIRQLEKIIYKKPPVKILRNMCLNYDHAVSGGFVVLPGNPLAIMEDYSISWDRKNIDWAVVCPGDESQGLMEIVGHSRSSYLKLKVE
jgi:hypothetical protein